MRILWFTNTPCGAAKKLNSNTASRGWLTTLESTLKKCKEIELHVAFYYKENIESFEYQGVHYYPIYDDRFASKFKILFGNYREYFCGFKNHNFEKIKQIVEKVNPDLIHYHGTESDFGLLQKEIADIPSVISIQGVLNSCYEKLYSGVSLNVISKYETLFSKLTLQTARMGEKRFLHSAEREIEIMKLSRNVIGRTDFDRHTTLAMSPNANYYIGNEILRKEFYENRWKKDCFNKQLTIVTTISAGFYKGLEVILRTATNLKRIDFDFKWIIIGQTESSRDAKTISKWLNQRFSDNNIEMVGRKNAQEMIEILKEADIYCQTGHIENSPNSVCEAMLLGMPVVASYAGGTCSMLEHNKEGYLLQDGDSFSLAGTIIEISRDFEKAKAWGEAAHQKAINRHDVNNITNEYLNIYRKVIKQ